jgi:hypothetical protein
MPYIKIERRLRLNKHINALDAELKDLGDVDGDLNYVIFSLLIAQFFRHERYSTINRLIGVLECCKAEFQRRFVGHYENKAIAKNGTIP